MPSRSPRNSNNEIALVPGPNFFALVAIMLGAQLVQARADTIQVGVDKLVFLPAEINARVGDTIEWVNKDVLAHTATVRGDWDVVIPANKSASIILRTAGTIEYYCRFHPNMKGRIIVAPE